MSLNNFCLGLEVLGNCNYQFDPPSVTYFTLGDAMAVIALIVGFTQLLRPLVRFRLQVRTLGLWPVYIVFITALACVFYAAALPQLPLKGAPIFGYPVVWEFAAGVLITLGSALVLWQTQRPAKINRLNLEKFYRAVARVIARGDDSELPEVLDELRHSIPKIVRWAGLIHRTKAGGADLSRPPNRSVYCQWILGLLSDRLVCNILVTRTPSTLFRLMTEIQKVHPHTSYSLVQNLVVAALEDQRSIILREEDFSGLGLIKQFTRLFFADREFANSDYYPFSAWRYWRDDDITPAKIRKYGEATVLLLKAHLKEAPRDSRLYGLNQALDTLTSVTLNQIVEAEKLNDKGYGSPPLKIISEIAHIFCDLVDALRDSEVQLPYVRIDITQYKEPGDQTIQGALAHGIYEFFARLSGMESGERSRQIAITLWLKLFPVSYDMLSFNVWQVQIRLRALLMEKVRQNLAQQFYPPIMKLLIAIVGIPEPFDEIFGCPHRQDTAWDFCDDLFFFIRDNFQNAWCRHAKRARDMLPEFVEYDPQAGALIQTWIRDEKTTLVLKR